MTTRRQVNLGLLSTITASVWGGFGSEAFAQSEEFTINWYPGGLGANFRRSFLETYEGREKAKVLESFDNARFTQMQANRAAPTSDVAVFTDVIIPILAKSGLVTPLTTEAVPNLASVPNDIRFPGDVAVPVTYGSWGIAYNSEKVRRPIESWADLVRDDLKGHVSAPNVTYNSSIYTLDALASLKGGSLRQPDYGLEMMKRIRGNGPGLWDQESVAVGWLKTGEIWVTPYFSGNVLSLQKDPDLRHLRFVSPKDGAYYLGMNVTKVANSRSPKAADAFINHMLGEKAQEAWARIGGARPSNAKAAVPPEVEQTVPVASKLKRVDWQYFGDNRDQIVNLWNRVVNA